MKTAISIPDDVFTEADRLAAKLKQSRSQPYSRAVREYVARHSADDVTSALYALYANESVDDGFATIRRQSCARAFGMVISQGDVWWTDLGEPAGSQPGFRRPVIVIQSDSFNRSRISTMVCVPLISDLRLADAPGNVLLEGGVTGLKKVSVANVSQPETLGRTALTEHVGSLPRPNSISCCTASTLS